MIYSLLLTLTAGIMSADFTTSTVDTFEDGANHWTGPAAIDGTIAHAGKRSLLWKLSEGETIARSGPVQPAERQSTLSLWIHSSRQTGAATTLRLDAPDEANRYEISFTIEWVGWNHLQLEKEVLRKVGSPDWTKIQQMVFSAKEGPAPPTVLHLDDITWTIRSPAWEIGNSELLIVPLYTSRLSPLQRWQPEESTRRLPSSAGKIERRWNAMIVTRQRDGKKTPPFIFRRPFNLDISDCQAVRVQAALPSDATLALSAKIDGVNKVIFLPQQGRNNWHEYRGEIRGKRLESLSLHCGDANSRAAGTAEYHFHFITLEKKSFRTPVFPRTDSPLPRPTAPSVAGQATKESMPAWLYFGEEDIPRLRQKVKKGLAAEMFATLRKKADRYLGYDPGPYVHDFYPIKAHEWLRPWTPSQGWAEMLETCAFTYALTGELRYAEQTKRLLMAMANTDHWTYGMVARFPVGFGGHGGPFCEASCGVPAALAYNWVYATLTREERRRIEEAILWKGWFWLNQYIDHNTYIRSMNQGPWFNYGALVTAAAIAHRYPWLKEFCAKYEANLIESIGLCYFEDGANTEGAAYWAATTRYVTRALPILAHLMGKDLKSYVPTALQKSIELPIYMRSQASTDWNVLGVNDGNYSRWNPGEIGLFFASLLGQPNARYAWSATAGKSGSYGNLIYSILWYKDWGDTPTPDLKLSKRFRGVEWFFLRSGFKPGDILFAFFSGKWGRGHQHHDKNSFVLEAYGERLCPDKGVPSYGDARGPEFQRTTAHNAVTINGQTQTRANARIVRTENADTWDMVVSDATGNYPQATRVVRRVLFRRPRYFVIADEVKLKRPASVEFNLHTFANISAAGDFIRFDGKKADLLIKVISPSVFTHRVRSTRRVASEPRVYDLQLATPRKVTEVTYLTVLYPVPEGGEEPAITYEKDELGVSLEVKTTEGTDEIRWVEGKGFQGLEP